MRKARIKRVHLYRICGICNERKILTEFYKVRSKRSDPNARRLECAECSRKRIRDKNNEYFRNNRLNLDGGILEKRCSSCGVIKPTIDFSKSSYQKDGYCSHCRDCRSEQRRTSSNREADNEQIRRRKARDPIRFKLQLSLHTARRRAKVQNVPFDLNIEYLLSIAEEVCPVFGIPLDYVSIQLNDNSPTLEKYLPHLGYVRGNVFIISHKANAMKRTGTIEDVFKLYKWMCSVEYQLSKSA